MPFPAYTPTVLMLPLAAVAHPNQAPAGNATEQCCLEPAPIDGFVAPMALPFHQLCLRFREEVLRYRSRLESEGRYAREVIRRAVVERDEPSWQELLSVYHYQVLAWCRRADLRGAYEPEELVAVAWEKFWRNFSVRKFEAAAGAAAVLRYLKLCAYSAVADQARAERATLPLDDVPPEVCGYTAPHEAPAIDAAGRAALWRIVADVLKGECERVVVELMFLRGLRSATVQARRPDLFASVDEVYAVTRNLLDRLRRNPELRDWLEREEIGPRLRSPRRRGRR